MRKQNILKEAKKKKKEKKKSRSSPGTNLFKCSKQNKKRTCDPWRHWGYERDFKMVTGRQVRVWEIVRILLKEWETNWMVSREQKYLNYACGRPIEFRGKTLTALIFIRHIIRNQSLKNTCCWFDIAGNFKIHTWETSFGFKGDNQVFTQVSLLSNAVLQVS